MPGAGSGLHCRGTAPASHMQCNNNAPRGRPLSRPPCPHRPARQPPRRALPHVHPTLLLGGGDTEARGSSHSLLDPSLSHKARPAASPVLCCWADPAVFCSPRGTMQGVERPRTLRQARPPAPALTLSMELSAGVVAKLSCRYPLAFSHIARLAGPDSAFPRPRMARAALNECRAALGRGFLLGPRQRCHGRTSLCPGSGFMGRVWRDPKDIEQSWGQGWGWGTSMQPVLTRTPAGHGAGAPPVGTAFRLPPHPAEASGSPQLSERPTTWPLGLCLQRGHRGQKLSHLVPEAELLGAGTKGVTGGKAGGLTGGGSHAGADGEAAGRSPGHIRTAVQQLQVPQGI